MSDYEFFPTPLPLVTGAFTTLEHLSYNNILDAGAGDGRWGKAAKEAFPYATVDGIDIVDRKPTFNYNQFHVGDYLTYDFGQMKYDLVVSNPPYSKAIDFINKSLALLKPGGQVMMLLKLSFLSSARRFNRFWQGTPLYQVHVCVQRPVFVGFSSEARTEYGVFIWRKDFVGLPTIKWLDWKK